MGAGADSPRVMAIYGPSQEVSAVDIYRLTMPLTALNLHGWRCSWLGVSDMVEHVRQTGDLSIFDQDLIVIGRQLTLDNDASQLDGLIEVMASRGARIVYEMDDDYTGQHRPADATEATCLPWIRLPQLSAITVSTGYLADVVRCLVNKPVYVIPNAIDYMNFSATALSMPREPGLAIMLAGTATHYHDWRVLKDVLPEIKSEFPDVRLLCGGAKPDYFGDELEYLGVASYQHYPAMLALADILCAPLVPDDQFNLSKTPIKAIEGWSAARYVGKRLGGCAVVATDCPVYRGTVLKRHNGLLVEHTPEAWAEALRTLITDSHLRQRLQIEAHKDAKAHDIATRWTAWAQAYEKILL